MKTSTCCKPRDGVRVEALMRGADLDAEDEDAGESSDIQPQTPLQAMGLAPRKLHVEWFINDHLGTPRQLINAQGETLWQTDYSPWGERLSSAETTSSNHMKTDQPIRFQGQFEDEESGLYYNRYRYYDPRAGRYLSKDPIGLKGGVNQTAYVDGPPLRKVDPSGLEWSDLSPWAETVGKGMQLPTNVDSRPEIKDESRRPDGLPWGDGCGSASNDKHVPDEDVVTGKVSFMQACRTHDKCYGTYQDGILNRIFHKQSCDLKLKMDMQEACEKNRDKLNKVEMIACKQQGAFYKAVLGDTGVGSMPLS